MTDGIGRILGGNSYGVGGYIPQKKDESTEAEQTPVKVSNYEETQVDPSRILDLLAANNIYVAPTETKPVGQLDEATQERIQGYMENFELIYGVIVDEFGEELAPEVMNIAMDYLMGLAA